MTLEIYEDALLLRPTDTEFKDFVTYTRNITSITEKHGICIIRPPKDWRPTFVISLDKKIVSLKNDKDGRRYSIYEFGDMADDFKMNFFRRPVDRVKPDEVEDAFWHLYANNHLPPGVEKVEDLRISGFANKSCAELFTEDKEYIDSTWNFNNSNSQCLLRHLHKSNYAKTNQVSSLEMCFSSQSWRIEEAFAYSLHYIHWGDSKTWYCIRDLNGEFTDLLESADRHRDESRISELTKSHKVIRARQKAGDFLLVHPRAATFSLSHGFNFSEKISCLPQDWFQHGHAYWKLSSCKRVPAFPFPYEELVFEHMKGLEHCGSKVTATLREAVARMVEEEVNVRMELKEKFPELQGEQRSFESFTEAFRTCVRCQKITFLSAVVCRLSNEVSCLQCYLEIQARCSTNNSECESPNGDPKLIWSFPVEELSRKLEELIERAELQDEWTRRAKRMLSHDDDDGKMSFQDLLHLKEDSVSLAIDDQALKDDVNDVIRSSEVILAKVEALFSPETDCHRRPTLTEVRLLLDNMKTSRCRMNKLEAVEEVIQGIENFIKDVGDLLSECPLPSSPGAATDPQLPWQPQPPKQPEVVERMMTTIDLKKAKNLLAKSKKILVDVGEANILEQYYERCDWIRNVQSTVDKLSSTMTLDGVQKLVGRGKKLCDEDGPLGEVTLEVLAYLEGHLKYFKDLDEAMKESLESKPLRTVSDLKNLVEASNAYPKISFPSLSLVRKVIQDATDWEKRLEKLTDDYFPPWLHDVRSLAVKGRSIPVVLDRFNLLETDIKVCELWLVKVAKIFSKSSNDDLMDLLSPRTNILDAKNPKKGLKKKRIQAILALLSNDMHNVQDADNALLSWEATELEEVMIMRKVNEDKKLSEESKYCLCRQVRSEGMLECRQCKELYHESCLNSISGDKENSPTSLSSSSSSPLPPHLAETAPPLSLPNGDGICRPTNQLEWRFICPFCHRTKRPNLEDVMVLMGDTLALPFRVAECRFVERIADRAFLWQKKVSAYLNSEEFQSRKGRLAEFAEDLIWEMELTREEDVRYKEIKEQLERICGARAERPSEPLDLSKEFLHRLEAMQSEGDVLEVKVWQTLKLEQIIILAKEHLERKEKEKERTKLPSEPKSDSVDDKDVFGVAKSSKTIRKRKKNAEDVDKPKKAIKKSRINLPVQPAKIRFYPSFKTSSSHNASLHSNQDDGDDDDDDELPRTKRLRSADDDIKRNVDVDDDNEDDDGFLRGKDDDLEDCSAAICLKPMGREVDWVQCDRCSRWFHLQCIGLSLNDVSEEDEFECRSCSDKR